jgi:hypothetical protein
MNRGKSRQLRLERSGVNPVIPAPRLSAQGICYASSATPYSHMPPVPGPDCSV